MGLDVRLPIGWLFMALGLLLVGFGLFSEPALYQRSLGININLIWGAVLLGFGVFMLALAQRAQRNYNKIKKESRETAADLGANPLSVPRRKE